MRFITTPILRKYLIRSSTHRCVSSQNSFSTCLSPIHATVTSNSKEQLSSCLKKNFSYESDVNRINPTVQAPRYYPQYSIFHSNCALSFKSIFPEFKKSGSGNVNIAKKGRFLLEFSPRRADNSDAYGNYNTASITDWNKSISIALSIEEIGQLVCDLAKGKDRTIYHHSPEGLLKTFQAIPLESEEGSYKFALTVGEGSAAAGDEIELNSGEMEVIKVLFSNSIPYLTGWHTLTQRSLRSLLSSMAT